jgi:hypothetical protein
MSTYYYDEEARALIAVNEETNEVRLLEPLRLDGEPDDEVSTTKPAKLSKGKGTGCPECGSPSRHKATCSRSGASQPGEKRKSIKRGPCTECGSKGARHRKTCSKTGQEQSLVGNDAWAALDAPVQRENAMSRMLYGRVKIANSHDIPSETIATNLTVSEVQVSKAIDAETYEDYLKL